MMHTCFTIHLYICDDTCMHTWHATVSHSGFNLHTCISDYYTHTHTHTYILATLSQVLHARGGAGTTRRKNAPRYVLIGFFESKSIDAYLVLSS